MNTFKQKVLHLFPSIKIEKFPEKIEDCAGMNKFTINMLYGLEEEPAEKLAKWLIDESGKIKTPLWQTLMKEQEPISSNIHEIWDCFHDETFSLSLGTVEEVLKYFKSCNKVVILKSWSKNTKLDEENLYKMIAVWEYVKQKENRDPPETSSTKHKLDFQPDTELKKPRVDPKSFAIDHPELLKKATPEMLSKFFVIDEGVTSHGLMLNKREPENNNSDGYSMAPLTSGIQSKPDYYISQVVIYMKVLYMISEIDHKNQIISLERISETIPIGDTKVSASPTSLTPTKYYHHPSWVEFRKVVMDLDLIMQQLNEVIRVQKSYFDSFKYETMRKPTPSLTPSASNSKKGKL